MPYPNVQPQPWQTSRISALRQQYAAPQVARLKSEMSNWMGMGYDPQSVQARRETIRGYGEGLSAIMGGAGETALSQYGEEYEAKERERVRKWEEPGYQEFLEAGEKHKPSTYTPLSISPYEPGMFGGGAGQSSAMGFAKGGILKDKKPYLVGEQGPELFIPNTKGTIIPNPKTQIKMKSKSLYIPRQYGGSVSPGGYKAPQPHYEWTRGEGGKMAPSEAYEQRRQQYSARVKGIIAEYQKTRERMEVYDQLKKERRIPKDYYDNFDLWETMGSPVVEKPERRQAGERGAAGSQSDFLTKYLQSIKTSPGPGFGSSMGSWMLKAQPDKYFKILSYLQGGGQGGR